MAINKVEANGETLIDLTNDTAEAEDVLEGQTFHLRSGAIATGTYKPSAEIEARLEATVGHSAINLFEPKYRQGTTANTTTANAVCSLTVIPTEYGKTHIFRKYNSNFSIRIYGTNDEGKAAILSGGVLSQRLRLYEGSYIYDESWTHTNETQGVTCYVIMVRKPNFPLADPVTYQNITPSDIPSNLVMVTDSSISDDSFEPYVTPTDEKKQDKPVELDPTVLTWNIADIQSKYAYLQIVCECIDTGVTPNMGLYDVITIPTVIFGRVANADKIMAFTSTMTMNGLDTVSFTESSGNVSAYIDPSPATGTRTIIQIIGIPK